MTSVPNHNSSLELRLMKFYLLVFLSVFNYIFAYASPFPSNQMVIQNVNMWTWPTHLTSNQVLDIYIEIMNSDSETQLILDQANLKLRRHNINHLSEIFKFCDRKSQVDNATAFFSQNVKIIETRISIPGILETPWSMTSQTALHNAFSSQVLKTPFIEFLAVSDKPEICIFQGKELLSSYDSVVHEISHFLLKDPFTFHQELLSLNPIPDFIQMTVIETGGELDAFKVGSSAAIRMIKNYNINGYSSESYQFFNSDGVLIDEDGLKKYLIKTYTNSYKNTKILDEIKKSKLNIIATKIEILKRTAIPAAENLKRPELIKEISNEIKLLEEIKIKLQTTTTDVQP